MAEIAITDVSADGPIIRSRIEYTADCRPFFETRNFFVEYDVNVTDVPPGVCSIPVLAQVCPVAWVIGADVRVPVVDRRFLESLRTVGAVLARMYPGFIEGGTVIAGEAAETDGTIHDDGNVGLLFTGGVDSLATYIRHRDEDPTLITVQGWVIGIDDDQRWAHAKDRINGYGSRFDAETRFVRSNMLSFLDTTMLSAYFADRHDGGWYSAVGGGLGLLGLCAPLTVAETMETLYIAATIWEGIDIPEVVSHWNGRGMPWGSHPSIDGRITWGRTRVVHDAFDLTRQERIGAIANFIREGHPDVPIRSCTDSETAGNCSRCEKCFRTSLGLAIEGIDPNHHGFILDRGRLAHAREEFEAGAWLDDEHHVSYWEDLLAHAPSAGDYPVEGTAEFIDWLRDVELEAIAGHPRRDRLVRTVARHTPYPLYASLYPYYSGLKRRLEAG